MLRNPLSKYGKEICEIIFQNRSMFLTIEYATTYAWTAIKKVLGRGWGVERPTFWNNKSNIDKNSYLNISLNQRNYLTSVILYTGVNNEYHLAPFPFPKNLVNNLKTDNILII